MKTHFRIVLLGMLVAFQSYGAKYFSPVDQNLLKGKSPGQVPKSFQLFKVDLAGLSPELQKAPKENTKGTISAYGLEISLPVAQFGELKFRIADIPVMEGNAQEKFPEIKTFTGQCLEKPSFTLKMDLTPLGFHAAVYGEEDIYIIDPIDLKSDVVMAYKFSDFPKSGDFSCLSSEEHHVDRGEGALNKAAVTSLGLQRRDYRLAVGTNTNFVTFYGGTQALALSALTTKVNRMNGIYERDFAIRMNLVSNSLSLMGLFTVTGAPDLNTIHSTIATAMGGTSNFDIGHYVGLSDISPYACGFNGFARIGVVCNNSLKGEGFSQAGACAINDPWVDFGLIPHEVGHMFGANHTFNSCCPNSNGECNRNAGTAYEPGAGNSIMSYWFGCEHGSNDGSLHSFFHAGSWFEVSNYTTTGSTGSTCPVLVNTGNAVPTANAGSNFYVPLSTPLLLTGTSSDEAVDISNLTHSWDQIDVGSITPPNSPTDNAPLFRIREPSSSNQRSLPVLSSILTGTSTVGETLPSYARRFRMAFLVRDNRAGGGATRIDTASYYVVGSSGPFSITSPNSSTTGFQGASLTVTWNVAGTNLSPISTANVAIDLSTNNGNSFQTLLASTPNDGSQSVTLPSTSQTTSARIRVRAVGNLYFALSPQFIIGPASYGTVNSGNQTICNGGSPANITLNTTGVPVGSSYQWYFKNGIANAPLNTESIGTWSILSTATSSSYWPPAGLTQSRTFACRVSSPSFPGGSGWVTGVRQVTVLSAVNFGTLASGNQTFSETGDPASIGFSIAPSGGNGTFAYRWYRAEGIQPAPTGTTVPANWTLISGATSNTYDPPAVFFNYSYAVMVDPTGAQNCGGFTWASGVRQITISNGCLSYCKPDRAGLSPNSGLFINSVNLAGTTSASGFDNHYRSFYLTNFINGSASFTINTNTSGLTRHYAVFADWNRDGDFNDGLSEILFLSGPVTANSVTGSFSVPPAAIGGRTTIRVYAIAGYNPLSNSCPSLASDLYLGEVEDYCIYVSKGLTPGTVASGNQNLCNGTIPNAMSVSGFSPTTGVTFQWYSQIGIVAAPGQGTGTQGWNLISGATSATYTPTSPLTSSQTFACRVSANGSSLWASGVRQVTIRPVVNFGTLASGDQTFPGAGDPNPINFSVPPSGGSGNFTYQWYRANGLVPAPTGTSIPAGWTLINGQTSSSYDPPLTESALSFAVRVDPAGSPDCGVATWATGVRQINAGASPFSPGVLAAGDQFICNGAGPASILFSTAPTAGSTYQWYFRDGLVPAPANTDPIGTWQILTGQTGSFLTPGAIFASRTYACRVTNGSNSQWATGVRQVTVLAPFHPGTILGGDQTFCGSGDPANITMSIIPVGSGGYTWRWYFRESSTGDCPSGGTVPAGWSTNNTSPNITGTSLTGTGISFDPTSAGALNAGRTFAVLITPIANGSIPACGTPQWANSCRRTSVITCTGFTPGVLAAGNQTLCSPATPTTVAFSTAPTTGSTFQWYFQNGVVAAPANTDPVGTWSILTGQTSSTLNPGTLSSSRTFACRVTNGSSSQWATGVRQITVLGVFNPGTLAAGNESFTGSGDPAPISFSSAPSGGAGTFAYRWYSRPGIHPAPTGTTVPAEWTLISGENSASYNPGVQTASISFAAMVDPTGSTDCGPFTWASGVRQITISTISFSPGVLAAGNQIICNGATPNAISFSTLPTGGSTFQWYSQAGLVAAPANTEPIGIWSPVSGQTGNALSPAALTGNRTYACRVTNGSNSQWATGVRQVTVLPPFAPGSIVANLTSCPTTFDPPPVTMTSNPQGSGQFRWTWYYIDNTTAACPTAASSTAGPSGWTTSTTDTRFFGTSTTGTGIFFDATSTPTTGRTWVLRIIPEANGTIPACGVPAYTNCNRTQRATSCPGTREAVDDLVHTTKTLSLGQNIPNPFSQETAIQYVLPEGMGNGILEVYSLNGRVHLSVSIAENTEGEVKIEKGKLAPGAYFYRIRTEKSVSQTLKMIIQ